MNTFFTPVSIPAPSFKIGYSDGILTMGSCFAGHLGDFFVRHKLKALSNPTGIFFNPISLARNLSMIAHQSSMSAHAEFLVWQDGLCHSLLHHGQYSAPEESVVLRKIMADADTVRGFIRSASNVVLTLGTAHIYRHLVTDQVVANCHKIQASAFSKELVGVDSVVSALKEACDALNILNANLQIILTVSPVRHIKDGLIENNQSKAILLTAVHEVVNSLDRCHYFPAYEIQNDELRDYRFYAPDMVHPNPQAIEYIIEKFVASHLDPEACQQIDAIKKLLVSLEHRPIHPESLAHQQFLARLRTQLAILKTKYPDLDFSQEQKKLQ